ncbi:hypothetical protein TWF694_002478 [Orbilia ellipsospora]|uniref:Large ribosomal subunit protein mL67 n=1 Tax=Orbilia ellipsospora TaxID=2528407 RepID=A0AAV9X4M2_9PEZI
MRPPTILRAKFVPLPEKITEAAILATFPEKTIERKVFPKRKPEDDVGDLSRDANPLGSHIYFYNHLQSKRVIYSLYQTLYNNKAMKQMTFMGKKTVPSALRKDLWSPLLTVSFTNPKTGLKAFQHLRELRKLHETQWDKELLKKKVKERSRILQDQRANSIADLAAVCERDVKKGEKVRVRWLNIYDAEYAENWPGCVVHDVEAFRGPGSRFYARKMGKFVAEADAEEVDGVEAEKDVVVAEAKEEVKNEESKLEEEKVNEVKVEEAKVEEVKADEAPRPESQVQPGAIPEDPKKSPLSFWR